MPAITNVNELQAMNDDVTGTYWLANDIDASATVGWNGGAGFIPIGSGIASGPEATKFSGEFDARGHTISDLFINRPGTDEVGLFGWIYNAVIKNVNLTDVNITGDDYVGALIGYAEGSTGVEIDSCSSTGSVNGDEAIGGLIGGIGNAGGANITGTVNNSHSSAIVSGDDYVGGLIGLSVEAEINVVYANGTVTGTDDYVGGAIGYSNGDVISDIYARGAITGDRYVGGAIGYMDGGTLDNIYSAGLVTGNNDVGGLVGASSATANNCFWDTQTSGTAISAEGTGKTTSQMKTKSTFADADWDFIIIWFINGITNDGYPFHWVMPPEPTPDSPRATVAVQDKITLECVRNIEMAAGGRFYIDEEGNAVYKSRYARNA